MSYLSVLDLNVYYGKLHAVRDVSLAVERGSIVALLGANGAGKTSIIRALCGLITSTGSRIAFGGRSLDHMGAEQRVKLGMATVPEGRDLFRSLSVRENLLMGAYLQRDRRTILRELSWVYELFPALAEKSKSAAATLSGGQGQMLAIGRALMAQPTLLLLDEPSHGLAPNLVEQLFQLLGRLRTERNLTLLLVEQNAHKALDVADYGYVLETGELALEGKTADLLGNERIRQLYLGG